MKRHHEPPVLLYFSGFPGWLVWSPLQIFWLNNKTYFSLANANNSASFENKMEVWKWRFLLIHKQQTNFSMKLPMIPPGFSEPIRLQDLEDSARSQAFKKINTDMLLTNNQDKKNNSMKQLQRQVIRATFSYNLSRNIVALQFEKGCCPFYHLRSQLVTQQILMLQVAAL